MRSSRSQADTYIDKIKSLLKGLNSSGLLSEQISMQQHYHLYELTGELKRCFYRIDQYAPTLRTDRLRIFINQLQHGKLIHKFKLEDSTYFAEYPVLFPDQWQTLSNEVGSLSVEYKEISCGPYDGEKFFFGLTEQQHRHLFFTWNQNKDWGSIQLTGRTGKQTFIKHLTEFCEYFEKGDFNGK